MISCPFRPPDREFRDLWQDRKFFPPFGYQPKPGKFTSQALLSGSKDAVKARFLNTIAI
jgi:hypothetical protein